MILTYHKIHPESKTIWWVTPDSFYRQMSDLRSKKVVYLDDYDPADENQVVITFDGVYKEIWKYAVPILRHFGYPFELFVIGGTIGKDNAFDTVEPLTEFADLETLKKMVTAGGRLQWHSWSHARLAGTTDLNIFEKELTVPAELQQLDPQCFKWYAYPHGERDDLYRSQVTSRFIGALACDDGNDADRYDLNRLTVYENTRLSKTTVSLIIPCYNYGHLAAEAIESALLQTYPPDEILFIDDASSDSSLEIARRYEPRIRVEANEKNMGVVENFRKAVELTSGDYIVFLGADNRFRSDYVEESKAILDANPDVGMVYTHFALFGPRAAVEAAHTGGVPHPAAPDIFIRKFPANPETDIREKNYVHGSSMYRRAAYNDAGGYVKDYMPEDNSLFARMLDKGWKARLWDAPSLEYRHHSKEQVNHLKSYEMENVYLRREIGRLNQTVSKLENTIFDLDKQLVESKNLAVQKEFEALALQRTKDWKSILRQRRLKEFYLPVGSRIELWVNRIIRVLTLPFWVRRERAVRKNMELIRSSAYFDSSWYLQKYPDVDASVIDPARHYLLDGAFEGRDPGPNFSSYWYLNAYPDVDRSDMNPLVHYLLHGRKDGRIPNANGILLGEDAQTSQDPELLSWKTENLSTRIREHGGLSGIVSKAMWTLRRRGFGSLVEQIHKELTRGTVATSKLEPEMAVALEYRVVPYYLKHYFAAPKTSPENSPRIAIHLHLENLDQAQDFGKYLANVPVPFTLFVSIPNGEGQVTHWVQTTLPMVQEMRVTITPTHARNLVSFVVEFEKQFSKYDVVAHLHKFDEDFDEVMNNLFGSAEGIHQILQLLQQDASFVYSSQKIKKLHHGQVWGNIHPTLQKLAGKYWKQFPAKDARVEFPQGGVFWAKPIALEKFLALPVKYENVSEEASIDLEKLLLFSAKDQPGRNYRLHSPYTDPVSSTYENENDYSNRIVHNSVKVLSYYLPQFYPIPENDEWHGNGFTEWNKMRNTTPLFYGHDQQRAPHADIGYYNLTTTDVLKQQSQWMKQAGVAGQIFYHYWFTGKLILEKPAQMLLTDPGIDMPFCFCWANENWTRRWDGNEREILLKQDYSAEDAAAFINYLIPFFKDKRYITIEGRPVLFIYRPSSIPDYALYKKIWNTTCAQNGLPKPYVVAVLTRGATSPIEFDMDAGCERVLHDWTDNAVPNIKDDLHKYWDLNGSVLDYNAVADHYMAQPPLEGFTYFRSLIPTWDNSPRYGSEAYVLHNSTPGKFQQWLEHLVQDAEIRLPHGHRFVVVNAWNEWAESAILDPDKKHGYAYLNSIGRTLSDIPYEGREYLVQQISLNETISISFDEKPFGTLRNDPEQRRKFFACLAQSSLFEKCRLKFAQPQVAEWFEEVHPGFNVEKQAEDGGQFGIHLKQICYFPPDALEPMLQMALHYNVGMVIPTVLNDVAFTHAGLSTHWEWKGSLDDLPLILLNKNGNNLVKCCVDSGVFISLPSSDPNAISDPVSTIIRFHRSGDMKLLQNALYSLLAQTDCVVQPILAVQDLPEPMLAELQSMLGKIPFHNKYAPKVKRYQSDASCSDLRSLMLNQELKLVRTQFASFLDYDDVLFAGAYSWLIARLKKTGKNASFGLIYTADINKSENRILKRSVVYDYGKSYRDFYNNNHTPIHGFMLDTTKINLDEIEYIKCMKYMEDYYLTLQIFSEKDTDWESLREGVFIGDYYHYEDHPQTLANLGMKKKIDLLQDPAYRACEEQIVSLRRKVRR